MKILPILTAGACAALAFRIPPSAGSGSGGKQWSSPPEMVIDPKKRYSAELQTSEGAMTIDLLADQAPRTVNNFVFLAREGFYEGVPFHRIISGFMVQTGDPTGTGSGGPGYRFADEFHPELKHTKGGILSMANAGPNTNGSQFFICIADDTAKLQPLYNLFGHVTSGLDVAKKIAVGDHMRKVTIS